MKRGPGRKVGHSRAVTPYAAFAIILVAALLLDGEGLAALLALAVLVWFRWGRPQP